MPRSVSLAALQAALAQHTSEVFVELVELDHADLPAPIRFCNDAVPTVSNGDTYAPFPFLATLPDDAEDTEPRAQIAISNVDQSVMAALGGLTGRPTCTLSVVTASTPDTVEWGPMQFEIVDFQADDQTIVFQLLVSELVQEPVPYLTFSPTLFPALFA